MSVNAVDWALRFAPVDAKHNGAARVLMCLANVADGRGTQRASDAQKAGGVVQVQREHGQTPPVMAGSERADPSWRPTSGRAFQRVAPARRMGPLPEEPSGARPRLLRLERYRFDPRRTTLNGKQGKGKPRLTCGPGFRHGIR